MPQPNDVTPILDRLDQLPERERRSAFFAELDALPLTARARIELARWRMAYARGPYSPQEFMALAGVHGPQPRTRTPAAVERLKMHAEALAELERARRDLQAAEAASRVAERKGTQPEWLVDPKTGNRRLNPDRYAFNQEAELARQAELLARDHFLQAEQFEIQARPHQAEHKATAARNWLRALLSARKSGDAR